MQFVRNDRVTRIYESGEGISIAAGAMHVTVKATGPGVLRTPEDFNNFMNAMHAAWKDHVQMLEELQEKGS